MRRVLQPGGAVCALSSGIVRLESAAADAVLAAFYRDVIGPLWPPERRHVENGYAELSFPFERILAPDLAMEVSWSAVELVDYMETWWAGARLTDAEGASPWAAVLGDLERCWPGSGVERVYWPLTILAGGLSCQAAVRRSAPAREAGAGSLAIPWQGTCRARRPGPSAGRAR